MKILFSESEWYYRDLGLIDVHGVVFVFDGMRFYKKSETYLFEYSVFVCAYYTMPHNVILTRKFKKIGVNTVLCSDGVFDLANSFINPMHRKYGLQLFHPIMQDFFICVGGNEKKYFNGNVISMEFMPKRMISRKAVCAFPEFNKVLLTTANTAYFNDEEYELLLRLILDTTKLLINKNVDFSFRIFDKKLLSSINNSCGHLINNDIKDGFEDTLERYSSVITTPSSVAIVSMFHRRSTALLIYRDWPMFLQTGWIIPSVEVFTGQIDGFLSRDNSRMVIQDKLLASYTTKEGITDRILDISASKVTRSDEIEAYVIKSYENMLLSKFNFNFEWLIRKLYRKLRRYKLISNTINRLKKIIF
jgi:hypothetical protein